MLFLNNAVRKSSEYANLRRDAEKGLLPAAVTGLPQVHKAAVIDTMRRDMKRRALIVTADEYEGARLADDLRSMGASVVIFPMRDFTLRDVSGISHEYEHERLGALARIIDSDYDVAICSAAALLGRTMPPDVLMKSRFSLESGQSVSPDDICKRLIAAGYTRCDMVEGAGQFARRGDILDLFTPDGDKPVRVEFWGDDIDTICRFDTVSQRREDSIDRIVIPPVSEVLFESAEKFAFKIRAVEKKLPASKSVLKNRLAEAADAADGGILPTCPDRYIALAYERATLLDYTADCLIFVSESAKVKEACKSFTSQLNEDVKSLIEDNRITKSMGDFAMTPAELTDNLGDLDTVYMDSFARGSYETGVNSVINFTARQLSVWGGISSQLIEDVTPMIERGYAVAVLAGTEKSARVLADDLTDARIPCVYSPSPEQIRSGTVTVTDGSLTGGIEFPSAQFALFTHGKVSGKKKSKRKINRNSISSLDELHKGDYVVHASHGIGVFDGINTIRADGVTKDYITIKYAKQDVLYVPVTQLDLVSKYIGNSESGNLKLNRLGGDAWNKTRSRVKAAVKDMAKDLIKLYAERMGKEGYAFSADSDMQRDFEARFEYDETDDQMRCINEIKSDMERKVPMDRLLCGDVGFGKTEVALRAAFKCIADGKQCALLVPTTILAWQHYQTVLRRMEGMPVTVELLSRFRSQSQQDDITRRLRNGEIDMIIGTHKLIGNGVKFRDLGLLIIDEEQRFGVAQKEKIRQVSPNVDTLTLSATPIPRTLNMAMSGLRDMSTLDEAPGDRHPVQTYVIEYDRGMILEAIHRELRRGGQIYYLHNRVDTIIQCAASLAKDLPDRTVAVAHGQMSEEELSEVWRRLIDGEIDILVCTTIIETGVDVPNVNTLIIENADNMGLAQLHQLRGRVGRSSRRAYAYLTFREGKVLSEIAQKRLEAIREFTEFGSGFKIAMRDLEIRGAGNILGGEQHGHMDSVGYDMYIRLLSDAIAEEKGEEPTPDVECTIDLQIGAHIPENYISSLPARLGIYRRIADIRNEDDSQDVMDELIDRFGEPPVPVCGLIDIALLRNRCAAVGIMSVEQQGKFVHIYPSKIDPQQIAALSASLGRLFKLNAGAKPFYQVQMVGSMKPSDVLDGAVSVLEKI